MKKYNKFLYFFANEKKKKNLKYTSENQTDCKKERKKLIFFNSILYNSVVNILYIFFYLLQITSWYKLFIDSNKKKLLIYILFRAIILLIFDFNTF